MGVGSDEIFAILAVLIVILLPVPPSHNWFDLAHVEIIQSQIDEPYGWHYADAGDATHASKRIMRRTVPFLCHALGISAKQTSWVNVYFALIFYLSAITIMRRHLDRRWALGVVIAIASTFGGKQVTTDMACYYDTVAMGFLFAAMATKRPWLIAACIFLSGWTDERGLAASSFVALYWAWPMMQSGTVRERLLATAKNPAIVAIVVSWVVFFISRYAAGVFLDWHQKTGAVGTDVAWKALPVLALTVWTSIEGFWLIVAVVVPWLWTTGHRLMATGLAVGLACSLVISFMVLDQSRSAGYVMIAVPVLIAIFVQAEAGDYRRIWLRAVLIVCLLSPTIFIQAPNTIRLAAEEPAPLTWSIWFELDRGKR